MAIPLTLRSPMLSTIFAETGLQQSFAATLHVLTMMEWRARALDV